jgi:flagellar hook protein FlgE
LPATYAQGASLSFKQNLSMTLTAPDGTAIAVSGTTNKQNSGTILNAAESKVEVYAAVDGVFYNPTNTNNGLPHSNFTNISAETAGAGGYQPIALIGEVAGRNIDSLITDAASGKPMFSTKITLSSQVANGTSQTDTIPLIYNLDLSGTQLQASSFQVTNSVQNGEARSQLSSVSIDSSGTIVGVYGDGRKLYAGQIALAHFDASQDLIPTTGNAFAPSYLSGTEGDNGVIIGKAGQGSFGAIQSQALEQSNVDLSGQLVQLMILQRMYSADSQSVRAFDQTMTTTIQMTQ